MGWLTRIVSRIRSSPIVLPKPKFVVTDIVEVITEELKHPGKDLGTLLARDRIWGPISLFGRCGYVKRVVFNPLRFRHQYVILVDGHGPDEYLIDEEELKLVPLCEDLMREWNLKWAAAHPNPSLRYTVP